MDTVYVFVYAMHTVRYGGRVVESVRTLDPTHSFHRHSLYKTAPACSFACAREQLLQSINTRYTISR